MTSVTFDTCIKKRETMTLEELSADEFCTEELWQLRTKLAA
jgi:hypothetical protein